MRENNLDFIIREFFDRSQVYELYEIEGLSLTEDMHIEEDVKKYQL